MRVLVLDEDEIGLFVTQRTLADEFDVCGFTKLESAKHWAADNEFDLLIVEYSPRRDRQVVEILDQVRQAAKCEFMAMIFTVTRITTSRSQELSEAGFAKIYLKPLSYNPLIEFLKDMRGAIVLK